MLFRVKYSKLQYLQHNTRKIYDIAAYELTAKKLKFQQVLISSRSSSGRTRQLNVYKSGIKIKMELN
jgi:hypothetical protein